MNEPQSHNTPRCRAPPAGLSGDVGCTPTGTMMAESTSWCFCPAQCELNEQHAQWRCAGVWPLFEDTPGCWRHVMFITPRQFGLQGGDVSPPWRHHRDRQGENRQRATRLEDGLPAQAKPSQADSGGCVSLSRGCRRSDGGRLPFVHNLARRLSVRLGGTDTREREMETAAHLTL